MTDWKRDTRTPEEQVDKWYRAVLFRNFQGEVPEATVSHGKVVNAGELHARTEVIREQVIPRDELIMELVDRLSIAATESMPHRYYCRITEQGTGCDCGHGDRTLVIRRTLTKARSHGYTPER